MGEDATVRRTFTEAELFKLFSLDLTKDEWDAFAIMVTTGLRVQDDLLNAQELVVVDGVTCIKVLESKTKNGIRIVPIHPLVKNPSFPLNTTRYQLREKVRDVVDWNSPLKVVH